MRRSILSLSKFLAFVLVCCTIRSEAAVASSAPPAAETEDIEIVFENLTLDFRNVASITAEDIDAMFTIQKEWFESYFREGQRRELQTLRDSRDITTQFEFITQVSTTGADGKPGTKVTYNQKIGFLPSSARKLVQVDVDDFFAVYDLVMSAYLDDDAFTGLALMLRESVASFSTLEGMSFAYNTNPIPVPMAPPTTMPPPTPIMARPPAPTPGPPPSTAPPSTPAMETPSADIEIVYDGETIDFINIESATPEDIEAMFVLMKGWFESYYREQSVRRLRGLQTNDRRRDSRDISTQFEFVNQSVTTNSSGKPVNTVTYSQTIGFTSRRRNLFEVNVDDRDEVYALVMNIYKDEVALQDLAMTLRMNVGSFSTLEGISKIFNNMGRSNNGPC